MRIYVLFGSLILSPTLFATDKCSTLLAENIANTKGRGESRASAEPEKAEWAFGEEGLSIQVDGGKVQLLGASKEVSVSRTVTPSQLAFLKSYTQKRGAERFGVRVSQEGNTSALKTALDYANLHSSVYGEDARPLDAANQIEALIRRSNKQNPHLKITVTAAATQAEKLQSITAFADGMSKVVELHERGRLESAMKQIKKENDQKAGGALLDQILGKKSADPTIQDVLKATAEQEKAKDPKAVELTIDYSHDDPKTVHIERRQDGKLRISVTPGLMMKMDNLKSLVDWLQGQGFSGKDYDWRTYEQIDSTPFAK